MRRFFAMRVYIRGGGGGRSTKIQVPEPEPRFSGHREYQYQGSLRKHSKRPGWVQNCWVSESGMSPYPVWADLADLEEKRLLLSSFNNQQANCI